MATRTITLTDEHEAAVAGLVAEWNARKPENLPTLAVEDFIIGRLTDEANRWLGEWRAAREKIALANFYNKSPEEQAVILTQLGM